MMYKTNIMYRFGISEQKIMIQFFCGGPNLLWKEQICLDAFSIAMET